MKNIFNFSVFFFLFSCVQPQEDKPIPETQAIIPPIEIKELPTQFKEFGDSVFIQGKSALFFWPDSLKIEELKKQSTYEDDFYTVADDSQFYLAESRHFMDSMKVTTKDSDQRILVFTKNNGERKIIDLYSGELIWGIYLFDGKQDPKSIDIVMPADDFHKYFTDK